MKRKLFLALLALSPVLFILSCQKETNAPLQQAIPAEKSQQPIRMNDLMTCTMAEGQVEDRTDQNCCAAAFVNFTQVGPSLVMNYQFRKPKFSRYLLTLTQVGGHPTSVTIIGSYDAGILNCTLYNGVLDVSGLACQQFPEYDGWLTLTYTIQVPDPMSINGWINCSSFTTPTFHVNACQ